MIWIYSHLRKSWLLCFFVSLFFACGLGLLFPSCSANATDTFPVGYIYGTRTYRVGNGAIQNDGLAAGNAGDSVPFTIVNARTPGSSPINLLKVHLDLNNGNVYGDSSLKFNNFSFFFTFAQYGSSSDIPSTLNSSFIPTVNYTLSSGSSVDSVCSLADGNSSILVWQCDLSTDNYTSVSWVRFNWGDGTSSIIGQASTSMNSSAIQLQDAWVVVSSSSDPSMAELQQQTQLLEEQNGYLERQNDLLEVQVSQQASQYESEKAEEAEREESAQDSQSGDFLGSFGNLLFPFSSIFNNLGTSSCFTPTKVNDWLNTPGRQYCPWFPSSVSIAVSSVCLGLSSVIVFGFIIKWLNRSEM